MGAAAAAAAAAAAGRQGSADFLRAILLDRAGGPAAGAGRFLAGSFGFFFVMQLSQQALRRREAATSLTVRRD
jgi:hypothetical protein